KRPAGSLPPSKPPHRPGVRSERRRGGHWRPMTSSLCRERQKRHRPGPPSACLRRIAEQISTDQVIMYCFVKATFPPLAQEQYLREKVLVKNACAFLKQRLQRLAPDAVLTHAWQSFYRT